MIKNYLVELILNSTLKPCFNKIESIFKYMNVSPSDCVQVNFVPNATPGKQDIEDCSLCLGLEKSSEHHCVTSIILC